MCFLKTELVTSSIQIFFAFVKKYQFKKFRHTWGVVVDIPGGDVV